MSSMKVTGALLILGLVAVGCSSKPKKEYKPTPVAKAIYESTEIPEAVSVETKGVEQVDFASIEFDRGEAKLSEADRRHLNELAMKMTIPGKLVDNVKIVTWADRVVKNDQEATNTEIILARQRADSIKKYIERNLPQRQAQESADFYNMAENPQRYSTYMKDKGINLETAFMENGKPANADGRALVIIEYKTGPTPSQL